MGQLTTNLVYREQTQKPGGLLSPSCGCGPTSVRILTEIRLILSLLWVISVMMMLKMINPMSPMPTVAGGENKDDQGLTREEILEQEKLRKETLLQIEKERHKKYRKQDEQREV